MRGIGVEEAAAVGAKFLDGFLARDRTNGNDLLGPFQRRRLESAGQSLRRAEHDQREGDDDRQRQQNIKCRPRHIDPEIAHGRRCRARKAARQREGHGEAGRGGEEVMDGQPQHLREMTHRRLAAVVLPIGVGDEAERGVEREIGRHGVEAPRIQRQHILQSLQGVKREKADEAEGQHRHGVDEPALLARRLHAGKAVEQPLHRRAGA